MYLESKINLVVLYTITVTFMCYLLHYKHTSEVK